MTTKADNSSKSATMAELMARAKNPGPSLVRGALVEGTITKITPSEILADIHAKSEAYVLEKDRKNVRMLMSMLKVGDKVTVSVISVESEMGFPVVSLRRYLAEKLWSKLEEYQKSKEKLTVMVVESTKGGCIVETDFGVTGFLPNSYLAIAQRTEDIEHQLVGKKMQVCVLELHEDTKKIIFSQKKILSDGEFKELAKEFKTGQKITATVSNITNFGIFADVPTGGGTPLDGLIHASEITWENKEDPQSEFSIGKPVEVIILGIDTNSKRLDLSIKKLSKDPFEEIMTNYKVDQKVKGTVREVTPHAVFVDIQSSKGSIEGMIKKEKIPAAVNYKAGDSVDATISEFDMRRHRILLVPVMKSKFVGYR